jgi:hypothetical protein
MARVINGTLFVPVYNSTGNPGEWNFTGASYDNQADATGNGAADLTVGFLMFIQATDNFLATPVPGVMHRYQLTSITVIDSITIDGTILWDEFGPEVDQPTNGSYAIICEPSYIKTYGTPPAVAIYPNLPPGADIGAYVVDNRNVKDRNVVTRTNIEGATILENQIVFENGFGNVQLAQANDVLSEGTTFGVVASGTILNTAIGYVYIENQNIDGFSGLVAGPVYLSRTVAGGISQSLAGFVPGEHVIKLGTAVSATRILWQPEYDYEF